MYAEVQSQHMLLSEYVKLFQSLASLALCFFLFNHEKPGVWKSKTAVKAQHHLERWMSTTSTKLIGSSFTPFTPWKFNIAPENIPYQ